MKIIHDAVNARVVTEDDSVNLFYTDELECGDEIVDDVVKLLNEGVFTNDIIGSEGSVDEYLLNAPCSQEDRECIVEQLFDTLLIYKEKFGR